MEIGRNESLRGVDVELGGMRDRVELLLLVIKNERFFDLCSQLFNLF